VSNERSLTELEQADPFAERHIGPAADEQARMLDALGYASMDALLTDAIPASIREKLALACRPRRPRHRPPRNCARSRTATRC